MNIAGVKENAEDNWIGAGNKLNSRHSTLNAQHLIFSTQYLRLTNPMTGKSPTTPPNTPNPEVTPNHPPKSANHWSNTISGRAENGRDRTTDNRVYTFPDFDPWKLYTLGLGLGPWVIASSKNA